jgi:hypothetical protein
MNLQVNSNLALELPPDIAPQSPPKRKTDHRAELAAQFIPSGARVLDLGGGTALQPLLPAATAALIVLERAAQHLSAP